MEIDFFNLHHAYLLVGSHDEWEKKLYLGFAEQGEPLLGSPDYFVFKDATFGIEQARRLSSLAIRKAFVDKKVFFLSPETMTPEAQNALLKTFEEPISKTHFFLVVRNSENIIPTLRSRMRVVLYPSDAKDSASLAADKFLASPLKERLAFTKKFIEAEKNLSVFLDELLLVMREKKAAADSLAQVYNMRLLSRERGSAPRLILEHLSLVL